MFGENLAERVQFQADDVVPPEENNGETVPDQTNSTEQAAAAADTGTNENKCPFLDILKGLVIM